MWLEVYSCPRDGLLPCTLHLKRCLKFSGIDYVMERIGGFSVPPKEAADNSSYGILRYTDTVKLPYCVLVFDM